MSADPLRSPDPPQGSAVQLLAEYLVRAGAARPDEFSGYPGDLREVLSFARCDTPDSYIEFVQRMGRQCGPLHPFRDASVDPILVGNTLREYALMDPTDLIAHGLTIAVGGVEIPEAALISSPAGGEACVWLSEGSELVEPLAGSFAGHLWLCAVDYLELGHLRRRDYRVGDTSRWREIRTRLCATRETAWYSDEWSALIPIDDAWCFVWSRRHGTGLSSYGARAEDVVRSLVSSV